MTERQQKIIGFMTDRLATRAEIAAYCGVKKHPALIAEIEALVRAGHLARYTGLTVRSSAVYVYFRPERES